MGGTRRGRGQGQGEPNYYNIIMTRSAKKTLDGNNDDKSELATSASDNAAASTSTKPATRLQQPPCFVNTNLMKIKMEVDYNPPMKQEPHSILEPPPPQPKALLKPKSKKKTKKKTKNVVRMKKEPKNDCDTNDEDKPGPSKPAAALNFGQQSKSSSEEEEGRGDEFQQADSDDDGDYQSVVGSFASMSFNGQQPVTSSDDGSANKTVYYDVSSSDEDGQHESSESVSNQPTSSSSNTNDTNQITTSMMSSAASASAPTEPLFYVIPGQTSDDIMQKLKHISVAFGVRIKYSIAGFEGPEDGVRQAKELIKKLFQNQDENISIPTEEVPVPPRSRQYSFPLPLIPLLSVTKAFSDPRIFSCITNELDLVDILNCRRVSHTWKHMATVYLRNVYIPEKPAFFYLDGPSLSSIILKPTTRNFDVLERIAFHPDFLLDSLTLQLAEYPTPIQKLRVCRILTSIFASIKDSLTTLILETRLGGSSLPTFTLPEFSQLEYLEVNDHSSDHSASTSRYSRSRVDFNSIFPQNTDISSVFQNLKTVKWNKILFYLNNSLSLWDFLFPQEHQVFPNVEILEFSGSILQDDICFLATMFPSVKEFHFTFSIAKDFGKFCCAIFCFMKYLECLHLEVDLTGYQARIPSIDGAITGFGEEHCKQLLRRSKQLTSMPDEQLDLYRIHPSILNLDRLYYLGLTFHCCEWANCLPRDFKNILTIVSCIGAFTLMNNLTVKLTICVPSSFDAVQCEGVKKELQSLRPYIEISIQQGHEQST